MALIFAFVCIAVLAFSQGGQITRTVGEIYPCEHIAEQLVWLVQVTMFWLCVLASLVTIKILKSW